MNKLNNITDQEITYAIEEVLLVDERIPAHQIDLQTNEGIVTMSGSVPTLQAKERTLEQIETIKGVRAIVDQLEVRPVTRSDEEIRANLSKALSTDPATHTTQIAVAVEAGIVTLTGLVESWQKRNLIGWIAKSIKGVKNVQNDILFEYQTERSDREIEIEIKRRLERDVWVRDALIEVQVQDNLVILTGSVGSVAERSRAYVDAWVRGVVEVDVKGLNVELEQRDEMYRESKYAAKSSQEIKQAIQDAFLYDPRLTSTGPEIEVDQGVAVLTGVVDHLMAKRVAEETAGNTIGIWRVKNYLKVRPVDSPADMEIAQHIREALLWNPDVDRHQIVVSCHDGRVYLYGSVDSNYEKYQAEEIACRVQGVVDIENNLKVDQTERWKSDREIKVDIESRFAWSPFIEPDQITIRVEGGVVTLTGAVETWPEYNMLVMKAVKGGAKNVVSHLKVKSDPAQSEEE